LVQVGQVVALTTLVALVEAQLLQVQQPLAEEVGLAEHKDLAQTTVDLVVLTAIPETVAAQVLSTLSIGYKEKQCVHLQ
jgi:hypothetical protein